MDPVTPRGARGKTQDPNTPQRRSLYDLQRLIDEVFDGFAKGGALEGAEGAGDGARTCRAADLPAILIAFEEKRSVNLLDENEMEMLKAFAEQHPDLDVSSEQLVSLLSEMTADSGGKSEENSPTKAYEKQLPTPPTSETESFETSEMRSRTSSTSSGSSSSSRNSIILTASGTLEDSITSPSLFDVVEPSFPRSYSMPEGVVQQLASPPGTPIANLHQRSFTSNDLVRVANSSTPGGGGGGGESGIPRLIQHNRAKTGQLNQQRTPLSSSISNRQRSSPLIDLQNENSLRRSFRPAPPKSRRISNNGGSMTPSNSTGSIMSLDGRRSRQSSNENPASPRMMSPLESMTSPLFTSSLDAMNEENNSSIDDITAYPRSRQSSGGMIMRGQSPLFDTSPPPQDNTMQGVMFPPQSPLLDDTSFHSVPISPHDLKNTIDQEDADNDFTTNLISHTRPISTISTLSITNSEITSLQEIITNLQQELNKKNKDLESQKIDSYALLMEKEILIEEIKSELISKKKEEKELRSKEKINFNQILTLELQTATFRDERDKQKIAFQNARKQYEEQCNESEKLRNIIRSKDEELRLADENLTNANSDLNKITRERDYLQSQLTRLEEELNEARLSIEVLEEQKNENLQLKETIDRLRLDLDELRNQAKLFNNATDNKIGGSSSNLSRSVSGQESVPPTLSKNLGRELARRFAGEIDEETNDSQKKGENNDVGKEEFEDGYEEEEIVTTRRRLKRPTTKRVDVGNTESKDAIISTIQEQLSVEVCDVQIQVSPPEILKNEQSTQTEKEQELSTEEKRNALARDLSVDLDAVEEYLRAKEERARQQAAEPDTAPPPYQSAHAPTKTNMFQPYTTVLTREAKTILDFALQSSGNLLAYTLIVFLSGLLTGSTRMPVRHHHHIAPFDTTGNWVALNTLDLTQIGHKTGWRDDLWFILEKVIWKGISTSRRVPS